MAEEKPEPSPPEKVTVPTPSPEAGPQGSLYAALARAQLEFPEISKNAEVEVQTKVGRSYTFKYAELSEIIKATRPILAKHGLAVMQLMDLLPSGVRVLKTQLVHTGGGVAVSVYPIPESLKNAQDLGSVITYLRRYQYSAMICISAEDDDDAQNTTDAQTKDFTKKGRDSRPPTDPMIDPKDVDGPPTTDQLRLLRELAIETQAPARLPTNAKECGFEIARLRKISEEKRHKAIADKKAKEEQAIDQTLNKFANAGLTTDDIPF